MLQKMPRNASSEDLLEAGDPAPADHECIEEPPLGVMEDVPRHPSAPRPALEFERLGGQAGAQQHLARLLQQAAARGLVFAAQRRQPHPRQGVAARLLRQEGRNRRLDVQQPHAQIRDGCRQPAHVVDSRPAAGGGVDAEQDFLRVHGRGPFRTDFSSPGYCGSPSPVITSSHPEQAPA